MDTGSPKMPKESDHTFAATNPCHVWDLALAMWERDCLGAYISGYPKWRLKPPAGFPFHEVSWRTLVTYGLQRMPEWARPQDERLFRWQDAGFDRAAQHKLPTAGFLHGLPGQCLRLFERGRRTGLSTVLNHAMGPLEQQRKLVAPEYHRVGKELDAAVPLPAAYLERLKAEASLAHWHCVASTVVRDQLIAEGVSGDRIWVVPYGADAQLFPKRAHLPTGPFRICFAGRQSLRKGIYYLLKALEAVDSSGWELHCFGMEFRETAGDFEAYAGGAAIHQRGSLSQSGFAEALKQMDVLVLPSAEEAFGLVVVQALQVGVPCIVSDRVGAKDLLREGVSGSTVPFGDAEALGQALTEWSQRRFTVEDAFPWAHAAKQLDAVSTKAGGCK
jgi:glycosyltransferase involved in cell wall biosynthesis